MDVQSQALERFSRVTMDPIDAEDTISKTETEASLNAPQGSSTSDDLANLSTGTLEAGETQSNLGKVPDSTEESNNLTEDPTENNCHDNRGQNAHNAAETSNDASHDELYKENGTHNKHENATIDRSTPKEQPAADNESLSEEFRIHSDADDNNNAQNMYTDFDFAEQNENDEFGEFGDFDAAGDSMSNVDDEFGEFGGFDDTPEEEVTGEVEQEPDTHIEGMEDYVESLRDGNIGTVVQFLENFFDKSLPSDMQANASKSPSSQNSGQSRSPFERSTSHSSIGEGSKALLSTEASVDLWDKLSTDSVFYNPITGAVGQFQWTRSEINKVYLRSLGVTINVDDTIHHSSSSVPSSPYMDTARSPNGRASQGYLDRKTPSPRLDRKRSPKHHQHAKASSLSGINVSVRDANATETKKPEPEPELDIDIARAYCELTEDTVRVFPAVKLTSIITDLTRLQRQASDYLQYLLDQREQLIMDSETYNDLISCIVGHAQRLREQNPKDASPAMVQKKKQGSLSLGGLSLKRKSQTSSSGQAAFSASMGGGVVGIKSSPAGTGTRKIERGHSIGSIQPVATTSTPSHKSNNESLLD